MVHQPVRQPTPQDHLDAQSMALPTRATSDPEAGPCTRRPTPHHLARLAQDPQHALASLHVLGTPSQAHRLLGWTRSVGDMDVQQRPRRHAE